MSTSNVSVIIPTYNDSSTLNDAINSVLNQTVDVGELIIVDDCSTDSTKKLAQKYDSCEKIKYIRHSSNRGGSAARNTGIMNSSCEYLAFLDSDDTWHCEKLNKQLNTIKQNPQVDGCICQSTELISSLPVRIRKEIKNGLRSRYINSPSNGCLYRISPEDILSLQIAIGGASTLVTRRDATVKIGGFDASFSRHQDWEFMIRYSQDNTLVSIPDELVLKRDTPSPDAEVVEESKERYLKKFKNLIQTAENPDDIYSAHRFDLVRRLTLEGKFRRAAQELKITDLNYYRIFVIVWLAFRGVIKN